MDARPVGLGCMRLSTAADRSDARSAAVLDAALAEGVGLLDTADAYALDDTDTGHNERLLARLRGRATIVTKGGLTRPGGAWVPDGRARHLAAAARASRDRLGVDAIDLYLLHAIDPKVDLATSIRALAQLRDDGVARAIGIANVGPAQLERALAIAPLDAVEVELGLGRLGAIHGGLVAMCERRGLRLLAHRPLGGPAGVERIARDRLLGAAGKRLGASPAEVALAWLRSLSPVIVPLPGATRPETVASSARACRLVLDDDTRAALAARFLAPGGARTRTIRAPIPPRPPGAPAPEIVIVVGMQASGKTTLAHTYVARGFVRLNRDDRGGTLKGLARALDHELRAGASRIILDNTYATRASRAPIVEVARRHGAIVRCIAMTTPLETAQANAVERILERRGRLLEPDELRRNADPNLFAPTVQFKFRREYEPPHADEGFDTIEEAAAPRPRRGTRRALLVELDDVIWRGRPARPDAIELVPGAAAALAAWTGAPIAGTTWQPGADPALTVALEARLRALTAAELRVLACTHPAGPPICWCRKPLPGLALAFARAHDVDLATSLCLGRGPADRGFASRAGVPYADIADGWPRP